MGECVAFFWLIVLWLCVLTAQLSTGQCVAWSPGPKLSVSGTGNFVILETLSDLREEANKVNFPLMAPVFPAPAPELFPAQNCFLIFCFFSPMQLLLKEIHLLHTYFHFIFLHCFYPFFFIVSILCFPLYLFLTVLSLTVFSCPFFSFPDFFAEPPLGFSSQN